ncbi:hypothetical protein FOZ62_019593, partial [Perkinsus olseni]
SARHLNRCYCSVGDQMWKTLRRRRDSFYGSIFLTLVTCRRQRAAEIISLVEDIWMVQASLERWSGKYISWTTRADGPA